MLQYNKSLKHLRVKNGILYCDVGDKKKNKAINKTRFYNYKGNFSWQGIKTEKYKDKRSIRIKDKENDWAGIVRKVLIGNHNESTKFHLRYFEIAPGGFSSLEKHKHEHVVIGIRGKGKCLCGERNYVLNFLDTLYIVPNAPHQLSNPFKKPFGFLCIVNAKRDKPKIIMKGSRSRGVW
jgi:quercetin dioxygenase-like cupin family protein